MFHGSRNALRRLRTQVFYSFLILGMVGTVWQANGQFTTGIILGVVEDPSGATVPDATVTATSDRVPNGVTVQTDRQGHFNISQIPPSDNYIVEVSKPGFTTAKVSNINVTSGSRKNITFNLKVGATSSSVDVVETGTLLDTTSSRTDTTITSQEIRELPKTSRTYNSLLAIAPGVRQEPKSGSSGVGGIQIDGSSGLENSYYLDGVQSRDILNGALRQQFSVPLDFLQELNIITGGFEAQYGGATGGVISVSIKGGSNAFHGGAYVEGTGSPLNAGDRGYWQRAPGNADRADFFRPNEDGYSIIYPGGYLGGPILKDKLFFFAGYEPEIENTTRIVNYASGSQTFKQYRLRNYLTSRLDYNASEKLRLFGSWMWSPARRQGTLPSRDPRVPAPTNNLAVQGGYVPAQVVNVGANYSVTPRLIFEARYGYQYINSKDGNYGLSGDPYVSYSTSAAQSAVPVPAAYNFPNAYTNVSSTFGTVRDALARHNVTLAGTYIVNILGQQHTFKAGYDYNRASENVLSNYTNGYFQIFWGRAYSRANVTDPGGAYGYYLWQDGVRLNSNVHGSNQGIYLQDEWRFGRRLTFNIGIRAENEFIPPYRDTYQGVPVDRPISFGWGDKIVPRIGGSWDVLGDGKWKLSASFGFFTDVIKYGLAQGSFGGQQWFTHAYRLDNPNVFSLGFANPGALGPAITTYDNRTIDVQNGKWNGVDSNLKPFRSRDINVAFDHQLARQLIGSLRYTRKDILQAVEDIGVLDGDGNEVYVIGNPGFGVTRDTNSPYGQKTPNGQQFLVPKAIRQYDAVEARVQGRIGGFYIVPSYTWSRLYGNYSGLGNADESGRSDPNNNRSFDLPYYYFDQSGSQKNVFGLLGTDRTHSFKLFSSYTVNSKLGATTIGLNQLALSGTPDSTSVIYLSAPTFPYGRGDFGRTPAYTQTDLSIAHDFKFSEKYALRFSAEIRNLFNQDAIISRVTQINQSNALTFSTTKFFSGYDVTQYVHPGNGPGTIPYNPIYKLPGASYRNGGGPDVNFASPVSSAYSVAIPNLGAYQDFRTFRLGLRLTF